MRKSLLFILMFSLFSQVMTAQLSWSKQDHDFGTSQLDIPIAYEFKYINYSTKTVNINFVKTTCACLRPKWTKSTLAPGEVGELRIHYLPLEVGSYKENIKVFLDNNPYPQVITITGVVGTESVDTYHEPSLTNAQPTPQNPNVDTYISKPQKESTPVVEEKPLPNRTPNMDNGKKKRDKPTKPKRSNTQQNNTAQPAPTKPATPTGSTPSSSLKTTIASDYIGGEELNTAKNESYLTEREKAMIKEVNLVRSNPKGYIQVVEAYVKYMKVDDPDFHKDDIKTAKELIGELKKTPKLSILIPSEKIYEAAKAHGKAAKKIGSLDHQGKDGSWPWDRVLKYDKTMKDGNENIVGGMNDIRKSVLTLLIDSGIEGRGHRKTMLKKEWTHITCHEVGKVGDMPYMWLQMFGQSKNGNSFQNPSIPEQPHKYDAMTAYEMVDKPKPGQNAVAYDIPSRSLQQTESNSYSNLHVIPNSPSIPTAAIVDESIVSTSNLASNILPTKDCYTTDQAVYLRNSEKEMIAEINFLRTHPQEYVSVIEAYIDFMDSEISKDNSARIFYDKELKSANELIELLERLPALNALKPSKEIYKAAKIHGDYGQASGNLEKQGSDGSLPQNRIMKYATNMKDGDENLPYGTENVRYSIIKLLIDKDDTRRQQRKVLLNPNWDYVAVYEVGKVGNMHYWVQDFGESRTKSTRMFDLSEASEIVETNTPETTFENISALTPTTIALEVQPNAALLEGDLKFLSNKEQIILREINLVRSNPKQYAYILENYINHLESDKRAFPENDDYYNRRIEAATFVMNELLNSTPKSILKANSKLYQAAYQHGQDCKKNRSFTHWSSDGLNTWQRLQKNAPNIKDGDQSLVSDNSDIRESVISILIDHAIFSRNREHILLKESWTDFAAATVGNVGNRKDCWIITFGTFE